MKHAVAPDFGSDDWSRRTPFAIIIFGGTMQDLLDRLTHAQELTAQLLERL